MTSPEPFDLNLNTEGFVASAQQALTATSALNTQLGVLGTTSYGMNRALAAVIPGAALTAGFGKFAAGAASAQQQLAGLQATASVTGADFTKMSAGIQAAARAFPVGTAGAQAMYQTLANVGVAGKGTEAQMRSLSKTFIELGGSTGEFAPNLAAGLVQLDRTFGNQNLDPKRIAGIADSLVTVSKNAGASATSILSFSKSIAPLAHAAGIGENATLGISAAFARLGDDGVGAATAMNKILADLTRSVRDGGPQLGVYADIVGTTADNFERLFKANPTKALSQIVSSFSGPQGARYLDQLGLDGVRTQRSLQELSAGGGLNAAVASAVSGTGSGINQRAAEAAFGGLNDSMTKLSSTASQAGIALGTPLLGPLTDLINLAQKPIDVARGVVSNPLAQAVMSKGIEAGAIIGLGALMSGKILQGSIIHQLATAGPMRALAGGLAGEGTGFLSRFGSAYTAMDAAGEPMAKNRAMNAINQRAFGFGQGLSSRLPGEELSTGATVSQRLAGIPRSALAGLQVFNAATTESLRQAQLPSEQRQDPMRVMSARYNDVVKEAYAQGGTFSERMKYVNNALSDNNRIMREETRAARGLGPSRFAGLGERFGGSFVGQSAQALSQPLREAGSYAGSVGRSLARGVGGLAGSLGPIGLGIAGFEFYQHQAGQQSQQTTNQKNVEIYSGLNAYLDSMGKATESTMTLADAMKQASTSVATSVSSFTEAIKVSDADKAAAASTRQAVVQKYRDTTDAGLAAQVLSKSGPGGLAPDVMAAQKIDLLRQFDPDKVQRIMNLVGAGNTATGGIGTSIADLVTAGTSGSGTGIGKKNIASSIVGDYQIPGLGGLTGLFKPGETLGAHISGKQDDTIKEIAQALGQQFQSQSSNFGSAYATQEQYKGVNAAVAAAVKSGNEPYVAQLTQQLSAMLTGSSHTFQKDDIGSANFTDLLAKRDKTFGATYAQGGGLTSGPPPTQVLSALAQNLASFGGIGQMFNNTTAFSGRGVNQDVMASMNAPENAAAFNTAINSMITDAGNAGQGMSSFASNALDAANKIGNAADQASQLLVAASSRARANQQAGAFQRSAGQNLGDSLRYDTATSTMNASTPDMQAAAEAARQDILTQGQQQASAYASWLDQYHQYTISMERAQVAFNLQTARAAEDNSLNITRQTQDFNLSINRATSDLHLQQLRSQHDFNLALSRQVADAAKTMYDPYQRIQTASVWDAKNLLSNLGEQAAALAKQHADLNKIKKLGIDTNVIDMLGLDKTQNAQQLSNFLSDLTSDPALVAKFNKSAGKRLDLTKALVDTPDNVDYRRQVEDYKTAMSRQQADFDKQIGRQQTDFAKSLARNTADFNKAMSRQAADFQTQMDYAHTDIINAQKTITADLTTLQAAASEALTGQAVAWGDLYTGQVQSTLDNFKNNLIPAFNKAAGSIALPGGGTSGGGAGGGGGGNLTGSSSGSSPSGTGAHSDSANAYYSGSGDGTSAGSAKNLAAALNFARSQAGDRYLMGGFGNGAWDCSGFMAAIANVAQTGSPTKGGRFSTSSFANGQGVDGFVPGANGNFVIGVAQPGTVKGSPYGHMAGTINGVNVESRGGDGVVIGSKARGAMNSLFSQHFHLKGYADGSVFNSEQVVRVGEAGPEAVIPLDNRGIDVISMAMSKYASRDTLRSMMPGTHPSSIVYHGESITHDHRNDFGNATIQVTSGDPDDMARKLEARTRRDNLTKVQVGKR